MTRLSSRIRCLCPVVVFSLLGCLITIRLYSITSQPFVPGAKIQMPNTYLSQFGELVDVEELEHPPLSKGQDTQTTSLVDEFLDKGSQIRSFFFPDKRNAIDPGEGSDRNYYYPGRIWLDTDGNPIQAHGGGILYDERSRRYYWYGEYKDGPTYRAPRKGVARVDVIGVGCYSSKDLWTWKNEGVVLKAEEKNETHDLHKSKVLERPKVIYNEKTRKYVMWMHIDDANYTKASVGIAISSSPTGPFVYLYSKSPHGFDSRDMTIFKDGDGIAYLFYSSLHNRQTHIGPLSKDYLDVTNSMTKVLVGQHREAHAVFKHQSNYYMITSGCSGWAPNEALVHVAESIMGPWEAIGNPCFGANKVFRVNTFFAQSTFVLPMPGGPPGSFVFMADRWKPDDLRDSRYLWLPLIVEEEAYQQLPLVSPIRPKVSIFWNAKWMIPYRGIRENSR
ncbi:uncharacterized protein [Coffea arabica]|uniref:Beta-glucanase-like n=1 Tax=Coffea arabica TaxID=13443 RepID=A0A6P6VTE1_COFAR|nr:uncharacterized protein LOC113726380 [Coffea arabica]XP_027112377.1 uncharacterized protein LOC113731359 [Coffea arabica]